MTERRYSYAMKTREQQLAELCGSGESAAHDYVFEIVELDGKTYLLCGNSLDAWYNWSVDVTEFSPGEIEVLKKVKGLLGTHKTDHQNRVDAMP